MLGCLVCRGVASANRETNLFMKGAAVKLRLLSALTTARQWFDSDYFPEGAATIRAQADRFELRRCLPFLCLHLGCLGVLWVGWSWAATIT